jgi:uncharacterized membrane protein
VIAILITIMVLELKTPETPDLGAMFARQYVLMAYVLSFVYLGIYWNNHHHMLHVTDGVTGGILWANLHLLFWLSLVPFATSWIGEFPHDAWPTASYGVVLLCAGIAYFILQTVIVRAEGPDSRLARAIGSDFKGKASPVLYAAGIGVAFVRPWASDLLYLLVALMWLVPDRRIEAVIGSE